MPVGRGFGSAGPLGGPSDGPWKLSFFETNLDTLAQLTAKKKLKLRTYGSLFEVGSSAFFRNENDSKRGSEGIRDAVSKNPCVTNGNFCSHPHCQPAFAPLTSAA